MLHRADAPQQDMQLEIIFGEPASELDTDDYVEPLRQRQHAGDSVVVRDGDKIIPRRVACS